MNLKFNSPNGVILGQPHISPFPRPLHSLLLYDLDGLRCPHASVVEGISRSITKENNSVRVQCRVISKRR